MNTLQPDEGRLEGRWLKIDGRVVADETTRRIEELITSDLSKIAASEDGWDILYVDDRDGRKWELTYPHKEWHGGGPPTLTLVSGDYVLTKYRK